jgi:hypothetical protein
VVDLAGNLGPLANQVVTLDIIPPAVTEQLAGIGRLSGTGDASATLTLAEAGTTLASAAANSSGTWTIKLPVLSVGSHEIVASETDTAGNTGTASLGVTVFAVPAPVDGVSTADLSSSTSLGCCRAITTLSSPMAQRRSSWRTEP